MLFYGLGIAAILFTFIKYLPWKHWSVEIFDFPHLQVGFLLIVSLAGTLWFMEELNWINLLFITLLVISIVMKIVKVYPYTPLAHKEVAKASTNSTSSFSLVIANVYMFNTKYQKCIDVIDKADPDVVLFVETNTAWKEKLSYFEKKYPERIYLPYDNTYGMVFFSKLKIIKQEVFFLIKSEIPSLDLILENKNGDQFRFFGVHPEPPFPSEAETAHPRDNELMLVGKKAYKEPLPCIVAGDLNDVAWSRMTTNFQKTSGLLDPRKGRGLFNTFHAKYPLLRWPLDHIFHSPQFKLKKLKLLPKTGSDHFPVYVALTLKD